MGTYYTREQYETAADFVKSRTKHQPRVGMILGSGLNPLAEAVESQDGGCLMSVSATDGRILAERELVSPPVFDGLAAASGSLYLSTRRGQVVCFRPVD